MNAQETFTKCEADKELSWDCFLHSQDYYNSDLLSGAVEKLSQEGGKISLIQMNKTIDHRLLMVHENGRREFYH